MTADQIRSIEERFPHVFRRPFHQRFGPLLLLGGTLVYLLYALWFFNLPQVMWAISTKVNPAGDLVDIPNLSVLELDPGSQPAGITHKMIIDATTPVDPDNRGHYSQPVTDLPETGQWIGKLQQLLAAR